MLCTSFWGKCTAVRRGGGPLDVQTRYWLFWQNWSHGRERVSLRTPLEVSEERVLLAAIRGRPLYFGIVCPFEIKRHEARNKEKLAWENL